jgi:hypothetical protein
VIVSSERAEQSEARANRALAHFRLQSAGESARVGSGGLRGGTTASGASALQSHDAILRLVAIAEEFSTGRFVDAIEIRLPSDPVVSALWEAELDRSGDTWPKRNELWKKYKNVNIKAFHHHKELQGFIQARNSITHGLGGLTRRQLRNRIATVRELRDANIDLRGDSLVIDASHVEACAAIVKAFVLWLDASC